MCATLTLILCNSYAKAVQLGTLLCAKHQTNKKHIKKSAKTLDVSFLISKLFHLMLQNST